MKDIVPGDLIYVNVGYESFDKDMGMVGNRVLLWDASAAVSMVLAKCRTSDDDEELRNALLFITSRPGYPPVMLWCWASNAMRML